MNRKMKRKLGEVGYIAETIILFVYYLSIVLVLVSECWAKDVSIDAEFENEELLNYTGEFAILTSWAVNINTASYYELQTIDGIGRDKAKAIIKYRAENGAFTSIEQITEVNGIGENLFEKIRSQITV